MKTGPIEFIQQVRNEVSKVTWPSRNETMITTLIVVVFSFFASIFFFLGDQVMSFGIQLVLGLGKLNMSKKWYIVHAYSNFEKKGC